MTTNKRSSISEYAKIVMMTIFRELFNIAVKDFEPQKIDMEKMTKFNEMVKAGIYKDMDIFYNNPTREIFEKHFRKFNLEIEEINAIGKIQNITVIGLYEQTVKIHGEIVTMIQGDEIDIIDSNVIKVTRLRNR